MATKEAVELVRAVGILEQAGEDCASGDAAKRDGGYSHAASGVMSLKALNRQLSASVESKRRLIEQQKERVDNLHLQLENLLYKKAYLLREIRECRDFTTPSLKAVESEVNEKIAATDFHPQMHKLREKALAFLENETQLRKDAQRHLEERRQTYSSSEEILDGRRKIIDELPNRIQRVEGFVKDELDPIFKRQAEQSKAMEVEV